MTTSIFKRTVKSFARRQRRLTPRLEKAMDAAWPQFGVEIPDHLLNLEKLFGNTAPVICEIGFGHGDTLIPMALANPDKNYLGIEVHEPGIAAVMQLIIEHAIKNIRIIQNDAVKIMQEHIPDHALSRVHIYFPDPWPKKRHHKRRIIQAEFVQLLRQKLSDGGAVHCATDWENYAQHMMAILSDAPGFTNAMGDNQYADNAQLQLRTNTKFEKRGVKLGHGVWDVVFMKTHIP